MDVYTIYLLVKLFFLLFSDVYSSLWGLVIYNNYFNTMGITLNCFIPKEGYVLWICFSRYRTRPFIDCLKIQYNASLYNINDFNLSKLIEDMESSFCFVKMCAFKINIADSIKLHELVEPWEIKILIGYFKPVWRNNLSLYVHSW